MADWNTDQFSKQYTNLQSDSVDVGDVAFMMTGGGSQSSASTEGGAGGAYQIYDGCLVGMNGLRCKAGLDGGAWKFGSEESSNKSVTISPFTLVAKGKVEALTFTYKVFENLFGVDALSPAKKRVDSALVERVLRKFDPSQFKMKHVLGSGSFGTVVFADVRPDAADAEGNMPLASAAPESYALKVLSKVEILSTNQLAHVMDERRLLAIMDSPFILKLFGTYQTLHQVVLVTEAVSNGDMWSVIYEAPFYGVGLPIKLIHFYIASIVLALSHIHSKGIGYRDLKPENIMIDERGYIRIIDFGFCKTIPYTKKDPVTGETKVFAKSYTLCGTPGILTPFLRQ